MPRKARLSPPQATAETDVEDFAAELGPFVVAADTTRMPMIFTDAQSTANEIVYANESFLRLTGFKHSDLKSKPFREVISQKDRRDLRALFDSLTTSDSASATLRCLRKGGDEFDAAAFMSPVADKKGVVQQYFVSLVDLSEQSVRRKKDEERLNDRYRNAPGFIVMMEGSEHRFTFTNRTFEVLVGRDGLVGKTASKALPELVGQGFIDLLDEVYRTGCHYSSDRVPVILNRGNDSSPETRYVQFVYQPVCDEAGLVTGVFAEGSDVTDLETNAVKLKLMQNQLIHVARFSAMATLAASLAHELNQPLSAISNYAAGCASILQASGFQSDKLQEGLKAIQTASARAGKIVHTLRDMTRKVAPNKEIFGLGDALSTAIDLVRGSGCEGVRIKQRVKCSAQVRADRTQIEQVIVNLVRNACEAGTAEFASNVTVTILEEASEIRLSVEDDGPGVPPALIDSLFNWTDSAKLHGMGIGLSISRTIIDSHGGRITLDHTSQLGSKFSFWLPKAVNGARPSASA